MEKVYKTLLGYVEEDKVYSYTHVVLEKNEYETLMKQLDDCKKNLELQQKETQVISNISVTIDDLDDLADLEDAKRELERQIALNNNLLRINKERANAERELRPKKEHTGYVVLASQQYDMTMRRASTVGVDQELIWKTWIQTPFDVSMPLEVLVEIVEHELANNLGKKLGIKNTYISYKEYIDSDDYYDNVYEPKQSNIIFDRRYKANYREGFWEVEIQHLYELTVPEDMRLSKRKNNKRNH